MKNLTKLFAALVLVTTISACGDTTSDRALSGAGLGAAGGAAVGALTGGSAVTGAVLGGAGGAAVGGLTKSSDVDLGKPVWR
jgi:osmotically inducible lipoprotein OsmB